MDRNLLALLGDMLMAVNPYVQTFRQAADLDAPDLQLRIVAAPHLGHERRYNRAVVPEIALFRPDMERNMDVQE